MFSLRKFEDNNDLTSMRQSQQEMGGIMFVRNTQLSVVCIKMKANVIFPIYVADLKCVSHE